MTSFTTGFVNFPHLTQLDFTGPLQVLRRLPNSVTHIIAKSLDPVQSDCGLSLLPKMAFAQSPDLDLICVPDGGIGVERAIADAESTILLHRSRPVTPPYVNRHCPEGGAAE